MSLVSSSPFSSFLFLNHLVSVWQLQGGSGRTFPAYYVGTRPEAASPYVISLHNSVCIERGRRASNVIFFGALEILVSMPSFVQHTIPSIPYHYHGLSKSLCNAKLAFLKRYLTKRLTHLYSPYIPSTSVPRPRSPRKHGPTHKSL